MCQISKEPCLIDVFPDKAQYLTGQEIKICIELFNPSSEEVRAILVMAVSRLGEELEVIRKSILLPATAKTEEFFQIQPFDCQWDGFGVDVRLIVDDREADTRSTAFDAADSWKRMIRYGFLSEFYIQDENDSRDVEQMNKYHLNAIQFYDWMYRHEDLIPKEPYFKDALKRALSTECIKNKIGLCHRFGMKAMAYGAIYGASKDFFEEHKTWAFYGKNGMPQNFGDWLYIMNTSPDSPWTEHIVKEFRKAVELFDFDGIHMDTYGWPKSAYSVHDGQYKLQDLKEHFPYLIDKTRAELEGVKSDIGLTFNAVGSWPVEVLAMQDLDSVYIEVWDPCERYIHLNRLITRVREIGRKNVILAAYLKPFSENDREESIYIQKYSAPFDEIKAENCFLLVSAVIFASGGFHFLLGEENGVLTNNYYVEYGKIHKSFERTVRNYYDFIVRYGKLLFDNQLVDMSMTHANGINDDYKFLNGHFSSYGEPGKIWTIVKEMPGYKVISLINLTGIESDLWNEGKVRRPSTVENITVKADIAEDILGVFLASPDISDGRSVKLDFSFIEEGIRGRYLTFNVPRLDVWDLIYIKVTE